MMGPDEACSCYSSATRLRKIVLKSSSFSPTACKACAPWDILIFLVLVLCGSALLRFCEGAGVVCPYCVSNWCKWRSGIILAQQSPPHPPHPHLHPHRHQARPHPPPRSHPHLHRLCLLQHPGLYSDQSGVIPLCNKSTYLGYEKRLPPPDLV